MANRKLFALPPASGPVLTGHIRKVDRLVESVAPGYKQAVLEAGTNYASKQWNQLNSTPPRVNMPKMGTAPNPNGKSNNGGGPLVFQSSGGSVNNPNYALSPAPNPRPINLNSGLKALTFVNDYMTPVEGACSPLHCTGVLLTTPFGANNPLTAYFTNNICFDIQTKAQENVNFNVDLTVLSAANIVSTFNATINALQVYFYYSSILSYDSNSKNSNSGMAALRALIDPQTLSDIVQLGRRLEDTPIPPRIVSWVRYMSGTFLSSNTQGSPLIKIIPKSMNIVTGTRPARSFAGLALDDISTTTANSVNVLLRRCIKEWRIGKLYDLPTVPQFDKQFLTIFANLANISRIATVNTLNNVTVGQTTSIPYVSFTNNLDGLAFSMGFNYDSSNGGASLPGIATSTQVSATYPDNRYSFYTVSGVTGFYPVCNYPFLALSRQETTSYVGVTPYSPHLFGTDKCQNVTGAALTQAGQNTLDFLFKAENTKLRKGM